MKIFLTVLLIILIQAHSQTYPGCPGQPNQQPVINAEPTLLNSTAHGKKYIIQDPDQSDIYVFMAVLEGTAYEMGYALGTLFQEELAQLMAMADSFYFDPDLDWIASVPDWMANWEMSTDSIIEMGLRYEEIATEHFTPNRFVHELKGISDASGVDYNQLLQLNLFPELTRAACTILGAWGPATPGGELYHLRALDYVPNADVNKLSCITIYQPTEKGSHHFANFGWVGMIGSLAGYNGQVGVGERVSDDRIDNMTTIFGEPWMFVLRNVLQFADNLTTAYEILNGANRTYEVLLGVGSQPDNSFRGFQYSYASLEMYTDQNWTYNFSTWHPQMDGIVYFADGGTNPCVANILEANYGNVTAELIYRQVTGLHQTGNTIMAVYSYATQEVHISFATNLQPAYTNPIFYLNMTQIFGINVTETSLVES